ncbi:MAG: hypothetical protein ACPL4I_12300 [Bacteroidota bacterium]
MGKRSDWKIRIQFYSLIALTFCVIISWVGYMTGYIPLQTAAKFSVIALLLVGSTYALRRFVWTSSHKREAFRRVIFILCGIFWIGFFLWGISVIVLRHVFGLSADTSAFLALPCYLLGAYIADKLEKCTRPS